MANKDLMQLTHGELWETKDHDLLDIVFNYVTDKIKDEEFGKRIQQIRNRVINAADHRSITIVWCVDDVLAYAKDEGLDVGKTITEDDAEYILHRLEDNHDCNLGITWETISDYLQEHEEEYLKDIPDEDLPLHLSTQWAYYEDEYKERLKKAHPNLVMENA